MTIMMPTVSPVYTKRARLVDADDLTSGMALKRDTLAGEASMHPNTLASVLKGSSVQYANAHAVFTVLNKAWSGSKSRRSHVQYMDDDGDWKNDPALDGVFAFPRLATIMKEAKLKEAELADRANVAKAHLDILRSKKPLSRNLVIAIFEALRSYDGSLSQEEELIP